MPKKPNQPFPMKDEWKPTYKYPLMRDEAPDFNPNQACLTCCHLTYFLHLFEIYRADDEGEPDLFVWKCTLDGCNCISVMPMFSVS